ncbi:hypothetical protein DSM112329_01006 [Paraconexibacter sp. AEG42_29]|uniref:HTH luxR-type domain-containing protein n=1 Tax=Paraconexibacter sp. AEG42_29 TaxID=2997339 RepID=A0AAU7ARR6_9ACTN
MTHPHDTLVERAEEVGAIDAALDRAVAGGGSVVALLGQAGIGKTRLLDEARRLAAERGVAVLAASGGELERDIAHGVLAQLLERAVLDRPADERAALLEGAAALALPALAPALAAPAAATPDGIEHGVYWLLAGLADREPLLLLLDDAHWADTASLRALAYVARRVTDLPVVLLIATRPVEEFTERRTGALLLSTADPLLEPALLTRAGAERLADAAAAAVPGTLLDACHEVSGGNPFYLRETLDHVARQIADGMPPTPAFVRSVAPRGLVRVLLLRVGALGEDAAAVAQALAVLSTPTLGLLATVAQRDAERTAAALASLRGAGLLAASEPIRFVHPIVRTAIAEDLGPGVPAVLHARAAAALSQAGAAPAIVAHHLLWVVPAGDPATVATLRAAAGDALAGGAVQEAVRLLQRADAEPPPGPDRAAVLRELGGAEIAAGALNDAVDHLQACLEHGLDDGRAAVVLDLMSALAALGRTDAAVALADAELEAATGDDALRLRVDRGTAALFDPDHAADAIAAMRGLGTLAGATLAERLALAHAGLFAAYDPGSRAADVMAIGRRSLQHDDLAPHTRSEFSHASMRCFVLNHTEDHEVLPGAIDRLLDNARASGSAYGVCCVVMERAMLRSFCGDLAGTVADAEATLDLADDLEREAIVDRMRAFCVTYLVQARLLRGEPALARAAIDRSGAWGGPAAEPHLALLGQAAGALALADGDAAAALRHFQEAGAYCRGMGYEDRDIRWRGGVARALHALEDEAGAVAMADEQLALARVWGAPVGLGMALQTRAAVAARADARALLEEAVEVLRGGPNSVQLGAALIDLGRVLQRGGERTLAQERLREGVDFAVRGGAEALVTVGLEALKRLGTRPRRRVFSGRGSLTAAELQVTELAAAGQTNRQIAQALFVTVRTVESHLSAAYRKLDISSRRELAGALES